MFDLKGFRKANKISQVELADYLGIGQGFVSQMENGTRPVPDTIVEKLMSNRDWMVDGTIASSLGGDKVTKEEDLEIECEALRNKVAMLESIILTLQQQQIFGKDSKNREKNIRKITEDLSGDLLALRKENEMLRQQLEELRAQNEKYWAMIEKLTAK